MQETRVRSLGQEDALGKEMAIHSSILAWRIPQTEKPGGLQHGGRDVIGLRKEQCRWTSQVALVVKNPSANARDIRGKDSILGQGDALEKGMAIHSSILAWRLP